MARLIVTRGVDEGRQYELVEPVVTVGRHSSNTIILHDIQVSRRHLELRALPRGGHLLRDLGSGNGTLVNGRSVVETSLGNGDTITIGQTALLYVSSGGIAAAGTEHTERIRWITGTPVQAYPQAAIRTVPGETGSQIMARPAAATEWVQSRLAALATLYQATEAVSHILDLDQLLAKLLELIVSTVVADHGCFVIVDERGQLVPRVVRSRNPGDEVQWSVSRTIAEHVYREGHGVLISDVAGDSRFRSSESLHRQQVREVICTPMRGRRETVGILYLDRQSSIQSLLRSDFPAGQFTEDHLTLATVVAHQAAIAVEESRYHRALLQAERLAAIGQTIAALSHHIKNIMQGIRFGADLVRTALRDDDRELLLKGWKLVERNQDRIDHLILDMLSFSKEREPVIQLVDLNSLCGDVLELVRGRAAENHIELLWEPGSGVEQVPCDPDGIHRAVLNIVTNALDALEPQGGGRITVATAAEPPWAVVTIEDNGPGIPPEIVEDIFKPFVSTKGARGTGLGLPVSRKILREHGGDVAVRSAPACGTCFTLRLPLQTHPADATEPSPTSK